MALKLDNRPGQVYDPEEESRRVPETPPDDGLENTWSQPDQPDENNISSGIADAERYANSNDGQDSAITKEEKPSQNQNNDKVGKGFTGKTTLSANSGMSRKKKGGIAGVISVSLAGILIAGFMALPGFMINQLRDVMTGIGDLQTRQSLKYRRTHLAKMSDIFSRDGRLGGSVINEMQLRGYRFSFDPTDRNRIVGLTLPNGQTSLISDAIGEHISDYMEVKHPLRTSRWKTKRMNALYTRYKISRTSIVQATPDDLDDPGDAIRSKMAKTLDGEDLDVQTRIAGLPEDATEEQIANATDTESFAESNGLFDDFEEIGETGRRIEDVNPDAANLARNISTGVDPSLHQAAEVLASSGSLGGKALSGVKSLGATDLADKVCTVKGRLRAIVTAARVKRAVELMRYATAFMGAADSTRKGGTSGKLLSELLKNVTATDRNGNSIGASPGFSYAIKKKFSKNRNDGTRANIAVDGKLTGVFASIQDTTDDIPATSKAQCNVWQNPIVQIGAGIVEVVVTIFSGGSSAVIGGTAKAGVVTTVKAAIKSSINKSVAKSLLRSFAFQAAIEISFEGILAMTQIYAEKAETIDYTGQEVGGELGDILTAGAGTLNKQRSLQAGMVPATVEQYAAVHDEYMETLALERSQQSVFTRYLDPKKSDSLLSTAILNAPYDVEQTRLVTFGSFAKLFSAPQMIVASLADAVTPQTFAQDSDLVSFDTFVTDEDSNRPNLSLATDHAGNLQPILRTDIEAIDPQENINFLTTNGYIEPTTLEPLGEFQKHVENCVETVDVISRIEATSESEIVPGNERNDCLAELDLTVRFKAHLAYLDMKDSVEAEFLPETLESETATGETPTAPGNGTAPTGFLPGTPVVGANTSTVACPVSPTITDLGIEDEAYISGVRYSIRLCRVHGVRINSTYAKAYDDLFNAMANAGYTVNGTGGFRDMAGQIAGYAGGRGAGTFARPGFSNHQFGVAADISCQGGGTSYTAGTGRGRENFLRSVGQYPCLNWVFNNSHQFGLLLQCVGAGSGGGEIRASSGGCEWWHISPTGG